MSVCALVQAVILGEEKIERWGMARFLFDRYTLTQLKLRGSRNTLVVYVASDPDILGRDSGLKALKLLLDGGLGVDEIIAKELILQGANVEGLPDDDRPEPLHLACMGRMAHAEHLVRVLLKHGADLDRLCIWEGRTQTPLDFAVDKGYKKVAMMIAEYSRILPSDRTAKLMTELRG
ncbi:hypothetical protein BDD12DRAFT_887095 [Trichophaea hybrida]|nr:hypothetical protein BDD12DRAFT_887095 [Trichophaea hybrida]